MLPDSHIESSLPGKRLDEDHRDTDENSSLLSRASSSTPGDLVEQEEHARATTDRGPHHVDIRTLAMLSHLQFWQLWVMLGLLTGIGLMTIK